MVKKLTVTCSVYENKVSKVMSGTQGARREISLYLECTHCNSAEAPAEGIKRHKCTQCMLDRLNDRIHARTLEQTHKSMASTRERGETWSRRPRWRKAASWSHMTFCGAPPHLIGQAGCVKSTSPAPCRSKNGITLLSELSPKGPINTAKVWRIQRWSAHFTLARTRGQARTLVLANVLMLARIIIHRSPAL